MLNKNKALRIVNGVTVVALMSFSFPVSSAAVSASNQKTHKITSISHKKVSDEMIMLRAESVINRSNSGAKIKVLKIDRETKDLQIMGLVPIIIQVTYEDVKDVTEPINTVIYASEDGEAFVPGVINDKNGAIYGLGMVRKQLAEQQLFKALNPTFQTNPNPTIIVGKTEQAIVQGKGLKLGKDGLKMSMSAGIKENPVTIKKEVSERVSLYKGENVTPSIFWKDVLSNSNYIKDGVDGAPVFYVFFDPWCSACHKFFRESRDLVKDGVAQLRWIGFGIMPNYPGHPIGRSSLEAVAKIYSSVDKTLAFRNYMGLNILPNVKVDQSLKAELLKHIELEQFITNGGNPTPTAVFKSNNDILGVKIGITAEMIEVIVNSKAYKNK